ncbi:MAG: pyridoxamine 5-phosphate oxidase-related FMN-binding protein [Jatrophihabitantaceae bacterium]|nr:pyridoxamine 5-phosphate oxidase-related FMN-binding protein [Jatrophihabitantaceae bacterium]
MSAVYESISDKLATWMTAQPVFFVGSAPLSGDGRVNISPKGMAGTFAVTGPTQVAYLDYTGSGAETIAHLRENGRIVVMFCAFDGPPNIVRLHGTGKVLLPADAGFEELRSAFPKDRTLGQRSIVVVDVERVSDSCGYAVPFMQFESDREVLDRSHERRDPEYFDGYWQDKNTASIDGLPAMPTR